MIFMMNIVKKVARRFLSIFWGKPISIPPTQNSLLFIPAHELAVKIRNKEMKSEDVVEAYIERIILVNPILNAVVDERFEQALREARKVDNLIDSEVKTKDQIAKETPLLGVPITIKEHIAVKGMRQTGGLGTRKDVIADDDAPIVKLVKEAGAIILGVTNLPELCFDWANSLNCVYGRTVNPYDTRRCAGGSSALLNKLTIQRSFETFTCVFIFFLHNTEGGEGSILASCGSLIGLGTDVAGSVLFPSMYNGVFGHKPTWGLCINQGTIPALYGHLSHCFTPGPLCRYSQDLKLMMKILSGKNRECIRLEEKVSIKKLRFYYIDETPKGIFWYPITPVDGEIKDAHEKVIRYLQEKHQIIVEKVGLENITPCIQMVYSIVSDKNIGISFQKVFSDSNLNVNIVKETFKKMFNLSSHTLFLLGMMWIEIVAKILAPSDFHEPEQLRYKHLLETLQDILGDNGVILCPTLPRTALYHYESFLQIYDMVYASIFSLLGFPATHCPLGLSSEGLPLGIQIVSNLNNDHLCLAVAEELERGFGGWVKCS